MADAGVAERAQGRTMREGPPVGTAELVPKGTVDRELQAKFGGATREMAKLINPDLNPDELRVFMFEAMRLGLDPASGKQIYAVVYNRYDPSKRKMSVQIAIDGLRSIAARGGQYDGSAEIETDEGVSEGGFTHPRWARATVWRKGCTHPFVAKVRWEERRKYRRDRDREGRLVLEDFWASQPFAQLEKCAEAAALRKAFPMEMRGVEVQGDSADGDLDEGDDPNHSGAITVAQNGVLFAPVDPYDLSGRRNLD